MTDDLKTRIAGHQPPPIPNASTPIIDLVLADLARTTHPATALLAADQRARSEAGRVKYGVHLQAHNGRDALLDAYQEAQDLMMYLRQRLAEAEWADVWDLATDYEIAIGLALRLATRVHGNDPEKLEGSRAELERIASEPRFEVADEDLAAMLGVSVEMVAPRPDDDDQAPIEPGISISR